MSVVCVLFCFSSRGFFYSTQGELEILSHTVRFLFNDRKMQAHVKIVLPRHRCTKTDLSLCFQKTIWFVNGII